MKNMEKSRKVRIGKYGVAGLALTFAIAIAGYSSELSVFAYCEQLARAVIEFPGNLETNMRVLPERINPTWAESN